MNNQEAFTKSATHLLTQKAKAVASVEDSSCRYLSPDGLMCAIGCLIPEGKYNPRMEGSTIYDVWSMFSFLHNLDFELLQDLQIVHDEVEVNCWKVALQGVALSYDLTMPTMN